MQTEREPWYETNLFWGSFGLCAALVVTVIAARAKDLRWLLFIAWPFGGVAVWAFARALHARPTRRLLSTIIGSLLIAGALFWLRLELEPQRQVVEQRFVPGGKVGDMIDTLSLAKGYRVFFLRGGVTEATGFSAQLTEVFTGAGWIIAGEGRAFPPFDINQPITIQGSSLSDPGVLAAKSAFAIAGFKTVFKQEEGPPKSIMLYF